MRRLLLQTSIWVLFVFLTSAVSAQEAVSTLAFTASSDHDDAVLLTGYRVQAVNDTTGQVVVEADIGKPSYDPIRDIRVPMASLPNPYQADGVYHLNVLAVGPGGASMQAPSPSFVYCPTPPPPPPPTNQPPTVSITSPSSGTAYTAPATIAITANAADPDGTIARVDFLADGTIIGSDTSSPYGLTWTNVSAGSPTLTAVAYDNVGASATSTPISVTVSNPGGALPAPWVSVDLGSPSPAGSATYASGTFTVKGGGADIWGTSDQFQFVYQSMTGDGQIVARVATISNTNAWTKAGVMIRAALNANAAYGYALVSASSGVEFQQRTNTNVAATRSSGPFQSAPYWVKLVRTGSLFTAYSSANGTTWTSMGSSTITMGGTVYVGLAVTSHANGTLATATLTDVTR